MLASVHFDSHSEDALPACLWRENPSRLVSLWEMLQFRARPFLEAMSLCEQLRMATHDPKLKTFDPPALSHVKTTVDLLTQQLDQLGLKMSSIVARRVRAHLERNPEVPE